MTIRTPTAVIVADGTELTAAQAGLIQLIVDIGQGAAHDRARLALGRASPIAGIGPGSEVEVQLGYEDAPEVVLTGDVDEVSQREWGTVVEVMARPARMTKVRIGRSYVETAAADIVTDLLGEADVDEGEIDTGPTLAAFHVDERNHAWAHLYRLSRLASSELSTAADGSLNFLLAPGADTGIGGLAGAVAGAAASLLGLGGGRRFGAEIHEMAINTAAPIPVGRSVAPFGAASELGSSSWHVLVKEPAGSAPVGDVLIPAALRDRDAAAQLQNSMTEANVRAETAAWLTLTGDPSLRAGDTLQLSDLPDGSDPSVRVTRLSHRFSRDAGFVTRLQAEGAPA